MTSTTPPRFNLTPNLTAWRAGAGPDLVLIHGVGLSADAWLPMLPVLTKRFLVTAIDMPGHGGSMPLKNPVLADYTDAITAAIPENAVVAGHSMGALICIDLALRYRELMSCGVALNAIYNRSEQDKASIKQRADMVKTGPVPDHTPTLNRWFENNQSAARDACAKMLNAVDHRGYVDAYTVFAESESASVDDLRLCKPPMLFITGAQEPLSTPAMSIEMAGLVPNGRAIVVDDARHMMPMTHPAEVSNAIIDFTENPVN